MTEPGVITLEPESHPVIDPTGPVLVQSEGRGVGDAGEGAVEQQGDFLVATYYPTIDTLY